MNQHNTKGNYIKARIKLLNIKMETEVLLSGLEFPEGPRWRKEKLFFSDFIGRKVIFVDEKGKSEIIVELQHSPSGLGFLNDGSLLIVSMQRRCLMRLDLERLKIHADLSKFTEYNCNDSFKKVQPNLKFISIFYENWLEM